MDVGLKKSFKKSDSLSRISSHMKNQIFLFFSFISLSMMQSSILTLINPELDNN